MLCPRTRAPWRRYSRIWRPLLPSLLFSFALLHGFSLLPAPARAADTPNAPETDSPTVVADPPPVGSLLEAPAAGERGFNDLGAATTDLVTFEQILNDRIEDTRSFASINAGNELDPRYMPERRPLFKLQSVWLPANELKVYATEDVPSQLKKVRDGQTWYNFLVHPESRSLYAPLIAKYGASEDFVATPTSSHRSLLVWDPKTQNPPMLVKVSLNKSIGGVVRNLEDVWVRRSAGISGLIKAMDRVWWAERGVLFFDEPIGLVPKSVDAGMSLRSLLGAALPQGREIVPMFSLYSKPKGGGESMIVEMARKSGLEPREFVSRNIIRPLTEHAAALAFEEGLVNEPHEQNVLMEIEKGQPTGRFWYRDFGGFGVDEKLRSAAGRRMDFLPEGVGSADIKAPRPDFFENEDLYLRRSNLFAMWKSMQAAFPEINEAWVKQEYEAAMAAAVARHSGEAVRDIASAKATLKNYSNKPLFNGPTCLRSLGAM